MAEKPPKKLDPYWLDEGFEKGVVTLACSHKRFWGRIGHAIEGDCLALEPAKLALLGAHAVARDLGHGPDAAMLVLQRLRRWMNEGKHSFEAVKAVAAMFDDALEVGLPEEEAAVKELVPLLTKRMKSEAVRLAMEDYGKDGDFSAVTKLVGKANRLGDTETSVGILLGAGSYAEIDRLKTLEKLSTGIAELDREIGGGLRRGSLGIYLGGSNDGKSMALSNQAAWAIRGGLFVVYATLELPPSDVLARTKAALTAVPINAILDNPHQVRLALEALPLGPYIVQEFTPQATTMEDLEEWVVACEEQVGRPIDVMITDYGDKLIAPKSAGKDGEHGYSAGRIVFERMRIYANEGHKRGKIWHWTAAQATRRKDRKHLLGLDDVADSMHKVRVADLVVTLNLGLDNQITFVVAKNRYGAARGVVGPLPTDFEIGRMAPMNQPEDTVDQIFANAVARDLGGLK